MLLQFKANVFIEVIDEDNFTEGKFSNVSLIRYYKILIRVFFMRVNSQEVLL